MLTAFLSNVRIFAFAYYKLTMLMSATGQDLEGRRSRDICNEEKQEAWSAGDGHL